MTGCTEKQAVEARFGIQPPFSRVRRYLAAGRGFCAGLCTDLTGQPARHGTMEVRLRSEGKPAEEGSR